MVRKLFVVADKSDAGRCQGPGQNGEGQCRNYGMEEAQKRGLLDDGEDYTGVKNCAAHGAFVQKKAKDQKRVHDYRLQIWQQRVQEFSESERTKTLRGEIGILRLMLETIMNECRTTQDLMLYSSKIADIIMKIEKLVRSCDALESGLGMILDRQAALALSAKFVTVIQSQVQDPNVIDTISTGLIDAIVDATRAD